MSWVSLILSFFSGVNRPVSCIQSHYLTIIVQFLVNTFISHGPFSTECHTSSTRVNVKTSKLNIKDKENLQQLGKSVQCSLGFTGFRFKTFVKNTNEFSDLVSDMVFGFFLFGFRFLFVLSGDYARPLTLNGRETSVCSTCHHYIGQIGVFL